MSVSALRTRMSDWEPIAEAPFVGKDVIELLSSSMYINPLTIYREYVQNAADSIDTARRGGLRTGRVAISIDPQARCIRIRDNGAGIPASEFNTRLITIGASEKRLTDARGFRGVGRLAGLGYCQKLTFRSRSAPDASVREMRWDCRQLKTLLGSKEYSGDLGELLREVVTVRSVRGSEFPPHFFDVELEGVIRHRNDALLDTASVGAYLSEVAPVPFADEFPFRDEILTAMTRRLSIADLEIVINDNDSVMRPHRSSVPSRGGADSYRSVEVIEVPGVDGGLAAVGWVLHHGYVGALPSSSGVAGLRLRCGNMQIGESGLLDFIFPEPRFNAWSVGEFHILDRRIVPNARRDHFETNAHFHNLANQLTPLARAILARCRTSSLHRKWQRDFEDSARKVTRNLAILRQNVASDPLLEECRSAVDTAIKKMEVIVARDQLDATIRRSMTKRLRILQQRANARAAPPTGLRKLRFDERPIYAKCFELIYECSDDPASAKVLVDKMMRRLARRRR